MTAVRIVAEEQATCPIGGVNCGHRAPSERLGLAVAFRSIAYSTVLYACLFVEGLPILIILVQNLRNALLSEVPSFREVLLVQPVFVQCPDSFVALFDSTFSGVF